MTAGTGLLIDYEFCLGCSECEIACIMEHGTDPNSKGISVTKLGPWKTPDGAWQYDFIPIPTDWCDLCGNRIKNDRKPACVRRCPYNVIAFGPVAELSDYLKIKSKMLIFMPRADG